VDWILDHLQFVIAVAAATKGVPKPSFTTKKVRLVPAPSEPARSAKRSSAKSPNAKVAPSCILPTVALLRPQRFRVHVPNPLLKRSAHRPDRATRSKRQRGPISTRHLPSNNGVSKPSNVVSPRPAPKPKRSAQGRAAHTEQTTIVALPLLLNERAVHSFAHNCATLLGLNTRSSCAKCWAHP